MPTVDSLLRQAARAQPDTPFWVLEKDYALSYLLAGIAQVDKLVDTLVLKGGTALRKFYFPDYRFSEDLDFTATARLRTVDSDIDAAVKATQMLLQELGPFAVTTERLILQEAHPHGQDSFIVRVRFPSHREPLCNLKIEITNDEPVLLPPVTRSLLHRYPNPPQAKWRCYCLEEIVAEKLRALLQSRAKLRERGWGATRVCRDYYDLWYVLRQRSLDHSQFPEVLLRKCALRDVAFSSSADFLAADLLAVARKEWDRQVQPFVREGPSVERVLSDLAGLLADLPLNVPQLQ